MKIRILTNRIISSILALLIVSSIKNVLSAVKTRAHVIPPGQANNTPTNFVDDILSSLASPVFAEGDGHSYCWNMTFHADRSDIPDICFSTPETPISLCLKEGASTTIPVYLNSNYSEYIYNVRGTQTISGPPAVVISPAVTNFSGNNQTETQTYTVTASTVSVAQSGSVVPVDFQGQFFWMTPSTPGFDINNFNLYHDSTSIRANIQVEHVNTAPTVSNLTPISLTNILATGATTDVAVTADIGDTESNTTNVTFELTNNNFSTILQTHTYNGITAGSTVHHTFTGLSVGTYNWRVRAVETNALGNCTGFANADPAVNLTTLSATPQFTIYTGSTPTPAPTATPTPTFTPTPTPTTASNGLSQPVAGQHPYAMSNPSAPTCSNTPPTGAPDLFQISATSTTATLYFTPVSPPITEYVIAYGLKEGDEQYGVTITNPQTQGVVSYTIHDLQPNRVYYFKVRAGNGCAPGPWSKWKNATSGGEELLTQTGDNMAPLMMTGVVGMIVSSYMWIGLSKKKNYATV